MNGDGHVQAFTSAAETAIRDLRTPPQDAARCADPEGRRTARRSATGAQRLPVLADPYSTVGRSRDGRLADPGLARRGGGPGACRRVGGGPQLPPPRPWWHSRCTTSWIAAPGWRSEWGAGTAPAAADRRDPSGLPPGRPRLRNRLTTTDRVPVAERQPTHRWAAGVKTCVGGQSTCAEVRLVGSVSREDVAAERSRLRVRDAQIVV